jgi:hypothetical protein
MLLKFRVKRAPESCQNLRQKKWNQNEEIRSGAGLTGSWAGPPGLQPGLDPVRLPPGQGSGFELILR